MGEPDAVRARLRAALCAEDPWSALHALKTDRTDHLAGAVGELYRPDTDRVAFGVYLTRLLRTLGESGDAVPPRLFAEPAFPAGDRQDPLRTTVRRGPRLPAALLRT
ncbi:hypothetical protein [Streptomyces globisporus]|uniref:hypothetical protein n=1 Tax=Streptomyces globisporus TaxID=1908 RepID=UPI0004C98795|nr:hypothetical protein [Streptomyces globisporus]